MGSPFFRSLINFILISVQNFHFKFWPEISMKTLFGTGETKNAPQDFACEAQKISAPSRWRCRIIRENAVSATHGRPGSLLGIPATDGSN